MLMLQLGALASDQVKKFREELKNTKNPDYKDMYAAFSDLLQHS